jgi:oxidase EvaA
MQALDKSFMFIKSALHLESTFHSIEEVKKWVSSQNEKINVNVSRINFDELDQWSFSSETQNLKHQSGKFFSIDGIDVKTNWGNLSHWQQPIINQPEIGYLGFITKEFNGVLYFLLQAKIEPGNVNCVQLSPTLQATKSNYSKIHKGKSPAYLDYFVHATPSQILLDQLQSEQGARFLKKRNRNIIIKIDEEIPLLDNFIWLSLAQIKILMQEDNLVNMDTRTVISGIPYGDFSKKSIEIIQLLQEKNVGNKNNFNFLKSTLQNSGELHSFDDLIQFITKRKAHYELEVLKIPIASIQNWVVENDVIRHIDNKYFRVIAAKVEIENREVVSWMQPMIEPAQEGICAFVCKEINGILHFIVQTKVEAGNFDILELAPTVQCLTGNYRNEKGSSQMPFLKYALESKQENIIYDTLQSEEGGRFYKEQNRNMLILADDSIALELPENYIWMTLNQMQLFIKFNNYLNIQARSLIAAISFVS